MKRKTTFTMITLLLSALLLIAGGQLVCAAGETNAERLAQAILDGDEFAVYDILWDTTRCTMTNLTRSTGKIQIGDTVRISVVPDEELLNQTRALLPGTRIEIKGSINEMYAVTRGVRYMCASSEYLLSLTCPSVPAAGYLYGNFGVGIYVDGKYFSGVEFLSDNYSIIGNGSPTIGVVNITYGVTYDEDDPDTSLDACWGSIQANGADEYRLELIKNGSVIADSGWDNVSYYSIIGALDAGTYRMRGSVRDIAGNTVQAYSEPLEIKYVDDRGFSFHPNVLNVGESAECLINPERDAAVGDIYANFVLYKDGAKYHDFGWQKDNAQEYSITKSYTFTEPGIYYMVIQLKDDGGHFSDPVTTTNVHVTEPFDKPSILEIQTWQDSFEVWTTGHWFVRVTGGAGDYLYHYRLYKDGEPYETSGWQSYLHFFYDFTEPGEYVVQARVQDSKGNRSDYFYSEPFMVTAPAVPQPVLFSVATKYAAREVGQANRWTPSATGGSGALQYHYRLYKDGEAYKTIGWKTDASWAFTFTEPGEYAMQVIVKDLKGARSEYITSNTITVTAPEPKLASVASKYTAREVGQANRWTPAVTGGEGALQYHYRLYKDGVTYKTIGWKNDASWAFTFTEPGEYTMQVRVKDSSDARSEYVTSAKITVTAPAPKAPVLSSVATKYTSREVGQANRWTPKVTGGTGALQYHYRLYKDGVVYKTFGWMTSASYAVTFTEPGEYTMQVRVKDSSDARSEYVTSAKITVTAPAPKAPVLSSVATKYTSRTVGTANRWTPAVTGGTGALQYHYRLYKDGVVYKTFGWMTNASYAFTFTEPGEYAMQVRVKDANDMRSEYVHSPAIAIAE